MAKKGEETEAVRIYCPCQDKTKKKIGWWVIQPAGKKMVFHSKIELLIYR